jgi:hypothetical protein
MALVRTFFGTQVLFLFLEFLDGVRSTEICVQSTEKGVRSGPVRRVRTFFLKTVLFRGLDPSDRTRPTGPVRPDPSDRTRPTGPVRPIPEIGYIYLLVEVSYGYGFINLELALKELVFDGYCCYIFGANLRILFIKQISSKSRGCDVGCCYGICNLFG